MKTSFKILIFFLTFIWVHSAFSQPPAEDTLFNEVTGIFMKIPAGWEIETYNDEYILSGLDGQGLIQLTPRSDIASNLDSLYKLFDLQRLPTYKYTAEKEALSFQEGAQGLSYVAEKPGDSLRDPSIEKVAAIQKGKSFYELHLEAKKNIFQNAEPIFKDFLKSLTFKASSQGTMLRYHSSFFGMGLAIPYSGWEIKVKDQVIQFLHHKPEDKEKIDAIIYVEKSDVQDSLESNKKLLLEVFESKKEDYTVKSQEDSVSAGNKLKGFAITYLQNDNGSLFYDVYVRHKETNIRIEFKTFVDNFERFKPVFLDFLKNLQAD